jgi:hypothetical protein
VRAFADRWRLTLIACPIIAISAYMAPAPWTHKLIAIPLGLLAFVFADTVVRHAVKQPPDDD